MTTTETDLTAMALALPQVTETQEYTMCDVRS